MKTFSMFVEAGDEKMDKYVSNEIKKRKLDNYLTL